MTRKETLLARLLAAWMLLAVVLLLGARATFLNDAARFAALPLTLCAGLLLWGRLRPRAAFCPATKGLLPLSVLLTFLFFLFLSLPNLLCAPLFSEAGLSAIWWRFRWSRLLYLAWNWTGFLLAYLLSVFLLISAALPRFLLPRNPQFDAVKRLPPLGLYLPVLPLIAACFLSLLSTSQSLFISDAPSVWFSARDCAWSEWHTAGYVLFVRLCYLISHSQRVVTLIQSIAYVFIHNYVLSLLLHRGAGKRACRAYILLAVILFVPIYFLQVIIKDVVFSMSLLAFGAGVLRLTGDLREGATRKRDWIWTGCFGLCTCLFRHAGFLPVVVAMGGLLLYLALKNKRFFLRALVTGGCILAGYGLIVNLLAYRVLHFERKPGYITYSAPMAMIGAVAKSGAEIPPADAAVMEQVMPLSQWAACYEPYFSDTISRTYSTIGEKVKLVDQLHLGPSLLRVNLDFLLRYPATYIKAFFDLNSLAWEIATPIDGYLRSYLSYPNTVIYEAVAQAGYSEGYRYIGAPLKQPEDTVFSGFADLVNRYAEFLYGTPVLRCLFWRGGFANLCVLFAAAVLLKKRRGPELLGLAPVLAVTAGLLFSMPAQEVRYIFPNLEYGLLAGVYAYFVPTFPLALNRRSIPSAGEPAQDKR